jgi:hypothetical protein
MSTQTTEEIMNELTGKKTTQQIQQSSSQPVPQTAQPVQQNTPKTEAEDVFGVGIKSPQNSQVSVVSKGLGLTATVEQEEEFDYSEEKESKQLVMTLFADKGEGKTFFVLSFANKGDSISAISFDHKTKRIKDMFYSDKPKIRVYDGTKYYDKTNEATWLKSSERSIRYVNGLITKEIAKDRPDWIFFDAMEIFYTMCEMTMRLNYDLGPYDGVTNRNIWKKRIMYMEQAYNLALRTAKKGVIFSTYSKLKGRFIDSEGNLIDAKEIPKWYGIMEKETDVTIRTDVKQVKDKRIFTAMIVNSKTGLFTTNEERDVTNKGVEAFIDLEKWIPVPSPTSLVQQNVQPQTQAQTTSIPQTSQPLQGTQTPKILPSSPDSLL